MPDAPEPIAETTNNDQPLWQESPEGPSIFLTEGGGIGITVGGMVHVKPLRRWFELANADLPKPRLEPTAEMREAARQMRKKLEDIPAHNSGVMNLYPSSLRNKLDRRIFDKMEEIILRSFSEMLSSARADERERCAKIAEAYKHPSCPFDGPNEIEPHQPCPVCGDYGNDFDAPMKCPGSPRHNIARAIRETRE